MNEGLDTLLVSVDFSHGVDAGVLIVGRKLTNQTVSIVNAYQGKEAEDIYKWLTEKRGYVCKDFPNTGI